jgi:aerobic carbon-monoxide dehydrogenase small subunit
MASSIVTFQLGDREVEALVQPLTTLQSVLRYEVGDTSVKEGCRQGGCGSCTVLVDGEPMLSCLLPVADVAGRRVDTLASLTPRDRLDPLQAAFLEHFGFQCGYCTPGMVVTARALLDRDPAPSRAAIVEALSGNLCRCTGYEPIIASIEAAAMPGAGAGDPADPATRKAAVVR